MYGKESLKLTTEALRERLNMVRKDRKREGERERESELKRA